MLNSEKPIKYIFVTGGVISSLGKGLTASSIAMLLENRGVKIAMLKLDPYINVDPGTLSPFQHGEVYVTDDGTETDLDLGHYYRFTHSPLSKASSATSGQVYERVIQRERKGDFLGKTVQVIPHITDEIKNRILNCAHQEKGIEVVFVEIGGTVGDIESLPFLEAIRQFRNEHPNDCLNVHLTYVPYVKSAGEIKTKPTQHSVHALLGIGISPDIIICRCEKSLSDDVKEKISLFCSVPKNAVIEAKDVDFSIYEIPIMLHEQKIDDMICQKLGGICKLPTNLTKWKEMLNVIAHPKSEIKIGIVGKYLELQDAYKSIFESLNHAATALGVKVVICKFDSDKINDENDFKKVIGCQGYIVPGGFGDRGFLGKFLTAKYCRENNISYFGICLGMQIMLIEFARNILGLKDANSTEFDKNTKNPVVSLLTEQENVKNLGGTMRLGAYNCTLNSGSKAAKAYGKNIISERHRHRYEFNNTYKKEFEEKGILFSGILENENLCEIAEYKDLKWMLGVQFHPEFKSKPLEPHPLFLDFLKSIVK